MITADKSELLQPVRPARNLTQEVVVRISEEIRGGKLAAGTKLPTEQELMAAMGVSRTVIREAISALKADGLVITRQGSGAFVASDLKRVAFRIEREDETSFSDVIEVMELRVAVEVEAAGLAAERAGHSDRRRIETALLRFTRAIKSGDTAITEDFALHQAIAEATSNPKFSDFLTFLGRHVIPRQSIKYEFATPSLERDFLAQFEKEHTRIVEAILAQDGTEARSAMRAHLARSLQRLRGLAEASGKSKPGPKTAPKK